MNKTVLTLIVRTTAILLLIPFFAMTFTDEINWTVSDFAVMAALLLFTGVSLVFVFKKVKSLTNRVIVCGAVLFAFLLVWAELAVGLFGSPFAGS
jgi:uncharacterized protein YybS (DUF2232 family)